MTQQEANKEIIKILSDWVEKYPCLRFGQILANANIIQYEMDTYTDVVIINDPYSDSSVSILNRSKSCILQK